MNTEIKTAGEKAIETLAGKITGDIKPGDAMQYMQAALNMAHTLATLENIGNSKK